MVRAQGSAFSKAQKDTAVAFLKRAAEKNPALWFPTIQPSPDKSLILHWTIKKTSKTFILEVLPDRYLKWEYDTGNRADSGYAKEIPQETFDVLVENF
jgi:hypothetical protein